MQLSGRLRRLILFPPIRALIGFFWVGGAIGFGSGVAGRLPAGFNVFAPLVLALGAVLGYGAFVYIIEKRSPVELLSRGWLKEAAAGTVIGIALFSAVIGILFLLGNYSASVATNRSAVWATLTTAVMAGVTEELLIRAVAFRILESWLGSWLALGISALIFGLLHWPNPDATVVSCVAIALEAGVMLGAAYMLTRRVWLAVGIHISWNFTQSGIFGVPTSGMKSAGLLEGRLQGSALLSGGGFGPEASIVAVVVCLAAGVWMLRAASAKGHVLQPSWQADLHRP